jgi:hypothetical protein
MDNVFPTAVFIVVLLAATRKGGKKKWSEFSKKQRIILVCLTLFLVALVLLTAFGFIFK